MMEFIKPGTNIDFIRLRKGALIMSWTLILVGISSLVYKGGPSYGIDFSGGLQMHVRVNPDVSIGDMRQTVDHAGAGDVQVQAFQGLPGEYLLRVASAEDQELTGGIAATMKEALDKDYAQRGFEMLSTDSVGPRVGHDLRRRAILSVLLATIAMGIYIAFRFDARFGIGAAVALFHDVMITVGAISLFNYEVDLTIVAAVLTVIGYSVNDTVIISDRIRENMLAVKRANLAQVINRSINETLSRTVLTTGATLLVVIALFTFGGTVIHGFAFTLIVGFLIGTYSSIFVAAPIVEWWARREGKAV
jgi:preprotein translocase subunit SecF